MEGTSERGGASSTALDKPRLLIVGGGRVGSDLFERTLPYWTVSLVDRSAEVVDRLRKAAEALQGRDCTLLAGDATSSLVLEEAGIEDADAVVVTTMDDRVNREVCAIALERYGKIKVVSLVNDEKPEVPFPAGAVELVSRHQNLAMLLENRLHSGSARWLPFGSASGQIVETSVMGGSPVIGRPLAELNAQGWRVVAVQRDDQVLLPQADTVLEEKDRVLLVGNPEVLAGIAEYLRIGVSDFPRRYGDRLLVPVFSGGNPCPALEEAAYVAGETRVRSADLIGWNGESEREVQNSLRTLCHAVPEARALPEAPDPLARVLEIVRRGTVGCLVLPPPSGRRGPVGPSKRQFLRVLEEVSCPILIPRGSHPYGRILVPVTDTTESIAAAELALDLGRLLGSRITAASVFPPSFSVGEAELESQREALKRTLALANLYRMRVEVLEREGNPVREILRMCGDHDLLVLCHRRGRKWSPFRPDVSHNLIFRAPCSVLVVEMGKAKRT